MPKSTRNACVGDVIECRTGDGLLDVRRMVVRENREDGVIVVYFTPAGLGPYQCMLPHTDNLEQLLYENENAGMGESFWDVHPDFTGKTGEI